MTTQHGSFLGTRRGRLTLLLLCAVQFLDVADSSKAFQPDDIPAGHDRIPAPG